MMCPKCGSYDVRIQAVTDVQVKNRGCFGWLLWIILSVFTCGLILIIPLVTNTKSRSTTHSEAVCQCCGRRWWI